MPFCPKACDTCLKILRTLNCVLCNRFTSFYFAAAALHLAVRIPVDGGIINNNIFFAFQGIYGTMINFIFPRMVSKELFLYLIALNTKKKKWIATIKMEYHLLNVLNYLIIIRLHILFKQMDTTFKFYKHSKILTKYATGLFRGNIRFLFSLLDCIWT